RSHIVDIYTKDGHVEGYTSRLSIFDGYGLGFVVLTAGSPLAPYLIGQAVAAILLPAIDRAAREQAQARWVGKYTADGGKTSIVLKVDDGPGLRVSEFSNNGADVLQLFTSWMGVSEFRLYPTELEDGSWRMSFSSPPTVSPGLPGFEVWKNTCTAWYVL